MELALENMVKGIRDILAGGLASEQE